MGTRSAAPLVASNHELFLIGALLALVFVGPWIFGRLWSSANRHVTQKVSPSQQRANAALRRSVEFRIAAATPGAVTSAVKSTLNMETEARWVAGKTYLAEADRNHLLFQFGKRMADGWTALLEVEEAGQGVQGSYGIVGAMEYDGLLQGAKQMDRLEADVVAALRRHFPAVEFRTVRET